MNCQLSIVNYQLIKKELLNDDTNDGRIGGQG